MPPAPPSSIQPETSLGTAIPLWLQYSVAGIIVVLTLITAFRRWKRNQRNVRVTGLYLYPIKSCGRITVTTAEIGRLGILRDRNYQVVDATSNKFITARQVPQMQLIQPSFEGEQLVVDAPNMPKLRIPLEPKKVANVTTWKDTFAAGVYEDPEIIAWFSKALDRPCKLAKVLPGEEHDRPIDPQYDKQPHHESIQASFADAFPFLVISEESLVTLQKECPIPITMQNFRPNIVVSGCEAYEEDKWKQIEINGVTFDLVKPCSRCVLTTVNPQTGKLDPELEPLRTLRRTRRVTAAGFSREDNDFCFFGMNATHTYPDGKLSVGDKVTIML